MPRLALTVVSAALLLPSIGLAGALPEGLKASLEASPQYKGLAARYTIVGIDEGDLDGDGLREAVIAFRPKKRSLKRGGFMVLASRGGKFRLAWAGLYEGSFPESVSIVSADLRARVRSPSGVVQVTLTHGKDFFFNDEKESPFHGVVVTTSSVLKGPRGKELGAKNLLDGDTDTPWVDGSPGTGAGEWIQLEFPKPVELGLFGVIGGDHRSQKQWDESNRLFRFDLVLETPSDRATIVEDVDITAMLKLPSTGRRFSITVKDVRRSKWVPLRGRQIVGLKLEISSVHLGEKNDDVYVSEVELGALLPNPRPAPVQEIVEKAKPKVASPAPTPGDLPK